MHADGSLVRRLQVQPRAAANAVVGLHGDELKVTLKSPPVDGSTNDQPVRFLAALFDVPHRQVVLTAGAPGESKRVRVHPPFRIPREPESILRDNSC